MKRPNILIAVPCFSGNVEFKCVLSLMNLSDKLSAAGMLREFQFVSGVSQITSVRNFFANRAAFDGDKSGRPFTHILFIDADGAFSDDDVLALIKADKPIAALPFSAKSINWDGVAKAARAGVPADKLREYAGNPVFHAESSFSVDNKLAPIKRIGCGVMLVQARVFRSLAEAHPDWRYKVHSTQLYGNPLPKRSHSYNFFQFGVCPETELLLGEDYFFVDQARRLGFETFVLPSARTTHTGSFDYVLNLAALASLGSAPEAA